MVGVDSSEVTAFFEQVAGRWDAMHQDFYSTEVIDALAAHSALGAGAHVVDVGTGTGFIASGLAAHVGRVTGTDSAPAMLAQASSNLERLGISNVTLTQAPVDALPLDDGAADAAVANMVAHHVPDPATMLAEMARVTRVTRPGGTVAITDCAAHEHEWMRTEQADLWLGFTPEQIQEFFARAGLVEVDYAGLGTA
jgi:ArsR family transcriptional regulator